MEKDAGTGRAGMVRRVAEDQKGFALVTAIFAMLIVSILGFAILGVTSSDFKMTTTDSKSQGAYYIAEAGVNHMIEKINRKVEEISAEGLGHEAFFQKLDDYIDNELGSALDDFEDNFGETPKAYVTIADREVLQYVDLGSISEKIMGYRINSRGEIGSANRTVNAYIEVTHLAEKVQGLSAFDFLIYSGGEERLDIVSGAIIEGSVYAYNIRVASSNEIKGDLISKKSVELTSNVKVTGDIYALDGSGILQSGVKVTGDVNATKDVQMSSSASVSGSIFADGDVKLVSSCAVEQDVHAGGNVELPSGISVKGSVFSGGDVSLISSALVKHDIHAAGDVVLQSNATVDGNIFAGGKVTLVGNAEVKGKIYAGGNVEFGSSVNVRDIFTSGNVEFGSSNKVIGDINAKGYVGSNNKGNSVTINGDVISGGNVITRNNSTFKINGNVYAQGDVQNGTNNTISGNVESAQSVVNQGTIGGTITENGNPKQPVSPMTPTSPIRPDMSKYSEPIEAAPLKDFEPGFNNITVNNSSTFYLTPGVYRDLTLKPSSTVTLSGGDYYFNNIDAYSSVKLKLDLSNGPINVYAKNNIEFGSSLEVYVSVDGSNFYSFDMNFIKNNRELAIALGGQVYWEAQNGFSLNSNGVFLGTVLGNKSFFAASSAKLVGAYIVNEGNINVGSTPLVIFAPPTTSAPATGNEGEIGDDEGDTVTQAIIRIKSPIREI